MLGCSKNDIFYHLKEASILATGLLLTVNGESLVSHGVNENSNECARTLLPKISEKFSLIFPSLPHIPPPSTSYL